jgi:hypothetical protein
MPPGRRVGIGLIWAALAVFTVDSVRRVGVDRTSDEPSSV